VFNRLGEGQDRSRVWLRRWKGRCGNVKSKCLQAAKTPKRWCPYKTTVTLIYID